MSRFRQLFAKQEDPYAGADFAMARRLGSLLWLLGIVLALPLLALSPPTSEIGDAGWLVAAALIAGAAANAYALRTSLLSWTPQQLLASSYLALGSLCLLQWLAGGVGAPYLRLSLLPMLYVAAIHPPRRIAPFVALTGLALASPFIYGGWDADAAADSLATFVIWSTIAAAAFLMMSGIRAQRLALRHQGALAREEARIDRLTGVGNRRGFEEALDNEMARSDRMGVALAVAMGDIEDFKQINDEYGHLEGDQCLIRVAEAISSELRVPDRVFRWGGDEFVVLLPGTGDEGAANVAERLRNKVAAACRRPEGGQVWIRFGTAELVGDMTRTDLVEAADLALMAARSRPRS